MATPTVPSHSDSSNIDRYRTFALTTLFTPPSDCHLPILTSSSTYANYFIRGSDEGTTTFFRSALSCYPTDFFLSGSLLPRYSPGACPAGWKIVSVSTPLDPRVTFATCCPSDALVFSATGCSAPSRINEVTTINNGKSTILSGEYLFVYPGIKVAWESSDLPNFTPSSAPLLAYTSSVVTGVRVTSTPTHKPGANATQTSAAATGSTARGSSSANNGLSTGAKVGIGVGIGIGVLLVIALLAWMLLRKRKKKHSWSSSAAPATGQNGPIPISEGRYGMSGNTKDWPIELDARQLPWIHSELSAANTRAELESTMPELGSTDSIRRRYGP